MKLIPILLITLTTCQILQKSTKTKKDPIPLVTCLLKSDKLLNDLVEGYETIQKFLKDKDIENLFMTALRILPEIYNEVMKCVKENPDLKKKYDPFSKIRKEMKKLLKNVPKPIVDEAKRLLKEKGKEVAKDYCMRQIKIKYVCDHIDKI